MLSLVSRLLLCFEITVCDLKVRPAILQTQASLGTPESIHGRREEIIAWAKGRWPHPGIPAEETPEVIDELAEEADAEDPSEL